MGKFNVFVTRQRFRWWKFRVVRKKSDSTIDRSAEHGVMSTEEALELFNEFHHRKTPTPQPVDNVFVTGVDVVEGIENISADESTVDDIYFHHIRLKLFRKRDTKSRTKIVTISILGTLKNEMIAWIGLDDESYGHTNLATFGVNEIAHGDEFRAAITTFVWGFEITQIVPGSFKSFSDSRSSSTSQFQTELGVPEIAVGTWRERLKGGDVVLTHVAFDGTYGILPQGKLFKNRPAAFVCWQGDYAIVRPIYGLNTKVTNNHLAIPLLELGCLRKPSAIRTAPFDVRCDELLRKLGSLSRRDRIALGFEKGEALSVVASLTSEDVGANTKTPGSQPLPFSRVTGGWQREIREITETFARMGVREDASRLLQKLIKEYLTSTEIMFQMRNVGLEFAAVSSSFVYICHACGIKTDEVKFQVRMTLVIDQLNESNDFELYIENIDSLPRLFLR